MSVVKYKLVNVEVFLVVPINLSKLEQKPNEINILCYGVFFNKNKIEIRDPGIPIS